MSAVCLPYRTAVRIVPVVGKKRERERKGKKEREKLGAVESLRPQATTVRFGTAAYPLSFRPRRSAPLDD